MIPELRKDFNHYFTEEAYQKLVDEINTALKYPADFRISETPVFLPDDLKSLLEEACNDIITQIMDPAFKEYSSKGIPEELFVPGDEKHPYFISIDFAITKNSRGEFTPALIELQGFPTLYCYQYYLDKIVKRNYPVSNALTPYFNGMNEKEYLRLLNELILGNEKPENVILMEIHPDKQKTRIDFAATEELIGIKPVCITEITKKGKQLFYNNNGTQTRIKRIYNRVIFDELIRKDIKYSFDIREDLDVEWAGHPNWFFRISKHTLPYLKSSFVPPSFFLSDLESYPDNLSDYVLKPLYSFAGLGVEIDLTKEMLDKIEDRDNYILQKKIEYAPAVETPDGYSKVEIRMMYLWSDKPVLANNLIRMSKGKMMGVDFNKNKSWVGSSLGYHF
jgi:hypothetical protein